MRKAKPGLAKYIKNRMQRVYEILKGEDKHKQQQEQVHKEEDTQPPQGHVTLDVEVDKPTQQQVLTTNTTTSLPSEPKLDKNKRVAWTSKPMQKVRKIMEICTWTMMISTLALEVPNGKWQVCTPVSIEHGYDLLTETGRRKAEKYVHHEKPDLIVGEWMCSPFSSLQHINLSKSPELRNKILAEQREHAKVNAWIAKIEKWQRTVNKGMWLGEQPHKCGSWKLACMQEMQRVNHNTYFDMCSEGLKDPDSGLPMRKRTKLNHTSGILHHLLTEHRQCSQDHDHQPIEGATRFQDANGVWRSINRSTFAGWYTRDFATDVMDSFTQTICYH